MKVLVCCCELWLSQEKKFEEKFCLANCFGHQKALNCMPAADFDVAPLRAGFLGWSMLHAGSKNATTVMMRTLTFLSAIYTRRFGRNIIGFHPHHDAELATFRPKLVIFPPIDLKFDELTRSEPLNPNLWSGEFSRYWMVFQVRKTLHSVVLQKTFKGSRIFLGG